MTLLSWSDFGLKNIYYNFYYNCCVHNKVMSFSHFFAFSYIIYPIYTAIPHKLQYTSKQGCTHHTSQKPFEKTKNAQGREGLMMVHNKRFKPHGNMRSVLCIGLTITVLGWVGHSDGMKIGSQEMGLEKPLRGHNLHCSTFLPESMSLTLLSLSL